MKRIFQIIAALAALVIAFSSCEKESEQTDTPDVSFDPEDTWNGRLGRGGGAEAGGQGRPARSRRY